MFDVFVSYRHADAGEVRVVAQALRDAGLQVWLDESNIEDFASIHAVLKRVSVSRRRCSPGTRPAIPIRWRVNGN